MLLLDRERFQEIVIVGETVIHITVVKWNEQAGIVKLLIESRPECMIQKERESPGKIWVSVSSLDVNRHKD